MMASSLDQFLNSTLSSSAPVVLALQECDSELRAEALLLFNQLASNELDKEQELATCALLAEILFPNADDEGAPGLDLESAEKLGAAQSAGARVTIEQMDREESFFADRVREEMAAKNLTQAELASQMGIGQSAVSMMLNRACRPQRKTVMKFAEVLGVAPRQLWPDYGQ